MSRQRLSLLPVGPPTRDPGLVPWLGRELAAALGVEVREEPPIPVQQGWRISGRDQYDSDAILDALIPRVAGDETRTFERWVLAVTDADLGAVGRDFVFGEATLGGGWAVIGLARLDAPEPGLLRLRALKEALHELGHLAGLNHCTALPCVMRESSTAYDTDRKLAEFCPSCAERLQGRHQP